MTKHPSPVVAIDVGGTTLKGARVAPDGRILAQERLRTPAHDADAMLDALEHLARSLAPTRRPSAVGLGVPGAVRPAKGVVIASPNLPCWREEPVGPRLRERLDGTTVLVENDANAAALGEAWLGTGRNVRNLILVTLGTGVGGGIILNGRIWHGDGGRAGELGHTVVQPQGRPCGCGARGCLEAYAGSGALVRAYREALGGEAETRRLTPKAMAAAARQGDRIAHAVFRAAGRALGIAAATWIQLLDVRTLLVGGGVSGALDLLRPALDRQLAQRLWGMEPGSVRIERAALGEEAGVLGAARLALG